MQMSLRRKAAQHGQRHYTGKPCRACGGTLRYTSNAGCVSCQIKKSGLSNKAIQIELASRLSDSADKDSTGGV